MEALDLDRSTVGSYTAALDRLYSMVETTGGGPVDKDNMFFNLHDQGILKRSHLSPSDLQGK